MNPRQFLLTAAVLTAVFAFSACDKSSPTAPQTDPAAAGQKVSEATRILVSQIILLADSGVSPTAINFSATRALYQEALGLDPANNDAHLGAAITDILVLTSNPDLISLMSSNMLALPQGFPFSTDALLPDAPPLFSSFGLQLREKIMGSYNGRITAALGQRASPQAGPLPSYYQNVVESSLLPNIISAINHLSFILQNTNYVFLITPQMSGQQETYRIDATELYVMRAFLQLIAGAGSGFIAYNVDYDPENFNSVSQAWQPGSPFLALRTNGSQRMKDARTFFAGAAASVQSGLNFLMNEPPHTETDLIEYSPANLPDIQEILATLDTVSMVLSGPYTFSGGPAVNLRNFFDDAIPDYKQMVPAYTVSVQPGTTPGRYDAVLTWSATSFDSWVFPDPTMRGLFPGMTDASLKEWMELTAANWEQSVVIPGS